MRLIQKTHNPLYDLILLTLLTGLFFGALLGNRPYSAPSESRYIEIGREMAESGNYVTPRLGYVKYFEKPPLFYWAQAAWTKVAGVGFFESRVPNAFFAVLLSLLTYALGRLLYGRLAGLLSALVITTSLYLFALSRIVLLDVCVSVFLVATLTAFLYAVTAPPGKKRTLALYGMYAAAAGAVLTKGLIGMVLPGAVIFLWFACTGRWSLLKQMRIPTGTLLFLLIAVPWHILVWQHNPEHPQFYFIHEHWERYTTKVHGRYHPFWFFGAVLLVGLFPWVVFAVPAFRQGFKRFWAERKLDGVKLFLFIWVTFIFLFFSASDSKLIPYILPIFPPLAAMLGHYLALVWREQKRSGFLPGLFLLTGLLILMTFSPMIMLNMLAPDSKAYQAISQGGDEVHTLSIAALVAVIGLFVVYIQGRARHLVLALLFVAGMVMQLGDLIAANYSKDSMQPLANVILSVSKPGDEIVNYDSYNQDLPIYLKRRVTIVRWRGELEFGTKNEDTSAWMIDYDEFWKRMATPNHRMFIVMREEAYNRIKAEKNPRSERLYPILQDGRNILFANVPPDALKETKHP